MRPASLRFLALLIALLVTLPSLASTQARYFCRAMDRVLAASCCAHEEEAQQRSASPEISAEDCCARVSATARTGVVVVPDLVTGVSAPALIATLPPFALGALPAGVAMAPIPRAQAPPGLGPPLFLKNCSLLS